MNTPDRRQAVLRALCARLTEEDGVAPARKVSRSSDSNGQTARKDLQLCKQARRAIESALHSEVRDELLRRVQITDVDPAPDASRLRVRFFVPPDAPVREILARFSRARPVLRAAVANEITRKRTPDLIFEPAPDAADRWSAP